MSKQLASFDQYSDPTFRQSAHAGGPSIRRHPGLRGGGRFSGETAGG